MADLKPCPFCGGEATSVYRGSSKRILCKNCHSSVKWKDSKDEAVEAWNTRRNTKSDLKPCPFCHSENITINIYEISDQCYVMCEDCGAFIEKEVPWEDASKQEHDRMCKEILTKAWNRRFSSDKS